MQPEKFDHSLRDSLSAIRKRWWLVAIVFAVVVGVQAVRTARMTPIYWAKAQILIEKENPNILSIQEVMELDANKSNYYMTQHRILHSRSLAKEVIDELGIGQDTTVKPKTSGGILASVKGMISDADSWVKGMIPGYEEPVELDPAVTGAELQNRLVDGFLANMRILPVRGTSLVNLRASSPDPVMAARMANTLAETYIGRNLESRLNATQDAGSWLAGQLQKAKGDLDEAEEAIKRYREETNLYSLEERRNSILRRIDEVERELEEARETRIMLENRYVRLQKHMAEKKEASYLVGVSELITSSTIENLRLQKDALEEDLAVLLKSYKPKHPKVQRLMAQLLSAEERIGDEEARFVEGVRLDYESARSRETTLPETIDEQKRLLVAVNDRAGEYESLERDVEANRRIYDRIKSRMKDTDILAAGPKTNNIRFIDRAEIPSRPSLPNKPRNIFMAIIAGLLGGIAIAWFMELLDHNVKTPDDIERLTGMPFLGLVPILKPTRNGSRARDLIAFHEPKSTFAECYRSVRTSILFAAPEQEPRSLLITSAKPVEGKTVTAVNLAITMAYSGKNVLLVDADLRKPRLQKVFGCQNTMGLSTLLGGENDVVKAIIQTKIPNLNLLPSGPIPSNPSELLGSQRMMELLGVMEGKFDLVVLDCPPLIAVTDASVLASRMDGVVLVVRANATSGMLLKRCQKVLGDVKANLLGVVLNAVNIRRNSYYYSHYYHHRYYGEDDNGAGGPQKKVVPPKHGGRRKIAGGKKTRQKKAEKKSTATGA